MGVSNLGVVLIWLLVGFGAFLGGLVLLWVTSRGLRTTVSPAARAAELATRVPVGLASADIATR